MKKYSINIFIFSFFLFSLSLKAFGRDDSLNPYKKILTELEIEKNESVFTTKADEFDYIEESLEKIRESLKPTLRKKKNKTIRGFFSPEFPASFKTKPEKIKLSFFGNKEVSWEDLSPKYLKSLPQKDLKNLLLELGDIKLKLKWKNKEGRCQSGRKRFLIRFRHWEESNGASVLALLLGIKKESELLERCLFLATDAVTSGIKRKAAAIFTAPMVARTLVNLINDKENETLRYHAFSAAKLAQLYIEYWGEKKASQLVFILTELVLESMKYKNENNYIFESDQNGVLLGALLSGALLRVKKIKEEDERKIWIINSISNLAWAASTLLGVLPIAGSIVAGVAGTISLAVVAWDVVENKIGIRDFSPKIREIEGHIEFSALEAAKAKMNPVKRLEILEALAWMRSTVHINGLSD